MTAAIMNALERCAEETYDQTRKRGRKRERRGTAEKKTTRGEEEEGVKVIIVVGAKRKGKAKTTRLNAFGAGQQIIWQRIVPSIRRGPRRYAEIASLSIPLRNEETRGNQITRKSGRKQPRSSKEYVRLRDYLMNI